MNRNQEMPQREDISLKLHLALEKWRVTHTHQFNGTKPVVLLLKDYISHNPSQLLLQRYSDQSFSL